MKKPGTHIDLSTDASDKIAFGRLFRLLHAQGFAVGLQDYTEFIAVFDQFGPDGLEFRLAPLVCRSEAEQNAFYRVFADWRKEEASRAGAVLQQHNKRCFFWALILMTALTVTCTGTWLAWRIFRPVKVGLAHIYLNTSNFAFPGDTLLFGIGGPFSPASGDSLSYYWSFGDRTAKPEKIFSHVYRKPGSYPIHLDIYRDERLFAKGDTAIRVFPLPVRLLVTPSVTDPGQRVSIKLPSDSLNLQKDSLYWLVSQRFLLTERLPYSGGPLSYVASQPGSFTVYLCRNSRDPQPLARGTFQVRNVVKSKTKLEFLGTEPLQPADYAPEWPAALLLPFLLVLALLYGLYLYDRRYGKARARAYPAPALSSGRGRPTDIPFLNKDERIQPENGLARVLIELQQRVAGDVAVLDIGSTIRHTVRSHGLLRPIYNLRKQERRYLFLIDDAGAYRQQPHLFAFLAKRFIRENIQVDVFYYQRTLGELEDMNRKRRYSLRDLQTAYTQSVLVMVGDGRQFLNKAAPGIRSDLEAMLSAWEQRVLVTPVPAADWGPEEEALRRFFRLVPADLEGWVRIVQLLAEPQAWSKIPADWRSTSVSEVDFESVSELETYLGDANLFLWVCALAVHHRIRWEVTLALGERLLKEMGVLHQLNYSNLLKLSRVRWIRDGAFPPGIRLELLKRLSVDAELAARETMLVVLAETDHLVGPDSLSFNEKKVQQLTDSFILYSNDAKVYIGQEGNAREFLGLWPSGVTDTVLKKYLKNEKGEWKTPLRSPDNRSESVSIDEYLRSGAKRTLKDWWKAGIVLGLLFYLLLAPICYLGLQSYGGVISKSRLNGMTPLVRDKKLRPTDIRIRLDTASACLKKYWLDDTVLTASLQTADSNVVRIIHIVHKGPSAPVPVTPGVKLDSLPQAIFDNIQISDYRSERLTLRLTGKPSGRSLQIDLTGSFQTFTVSVSGADCVPVKGREVFIQYSDRTDAGLAEALRACLQGKGYQVPITDRKPYDRSDVVRYFDPAMKKAADSLAEAVSICLNKKVNSVYLLPSPAGSSTGLLEIWLNDQRGCPIVRLKDIPDMGPGRLYYCFEQSSILMIGVDSLVLMQGPVRYKAVLAGGLGNCFGIYTSPLVTPKGATADSLRFSVKDNGTAITVLNPLGNYGLIFDAGHAKGLNSVEDARLAGEWRSSNGKALIFSTGSDGTIQGVSSDLHLVRSFYDKTDDCYLLLLSDESPNIHTRQKIIFAKFVSESLYVANIDLTLNDLSKIDIQQLIYTAHSFEKFTKIKSTPHAPTFQVGMKYRGGVICYLDSTQQHGLICSSTNLKPGNWVDAKAQCAAYSAAGFNDWRLPTKTEFPMIYDQRVAAPGIFNSGCTDSNFGNCSYWTSEEIDTQFGWCFYFAKGIFWSNYAKKDMAQVRPVRSF